MLMLIVFAALLGLIVFNEQAKKIVAAGTQQLSDILLAGEDLSGEALRKTAQWIKLEWCHNGQKRFPRPLLLMLGLVALLTGFLLLRADFIVVRESLAVIWPFGNSVALLAFSMGASTALIGFLFHSLTSKKARSILLLLFLLLTTAQARLAYQRTLLLYESQAVEISRSIPNKLSLGGKEVSVKQTSDQESTRATEAKQTALFAAGIAVLVCVSEAVAFWAAFALAGSGLVVLFAVPLLFPFVVFSFLRKAQVADAIRTILEAACDVFGMIRKVLFGLRDWLKIDAVRKRRQASEQEELRRVQYSTSLIQQETAQQIAKETQRQRILEAEENQKYLTPPDD
jgi:hypothetical protein